MYWDRLTRVSPPVSEPVSLAEVKEHLNYDLDDRDAYISRLIWQATEVVEGPAGIGMALMSQQWRLSLDCFPAVIEIPIWPVTSVDSVTYTDTAGAEQTVAASDYKVDLDMTPARVAPVYGKTWPTSRKELGAVKVTFTAGRSNPDDVPESIKGAILLMIAHWFDNRSAVVTGATSSEVPMGVQHILNHYRAGRFA